MNLLLLLLYNFIEVTLFHTCAMALQTNNSLVLVPFRYKAFPLGSITASGWLNDQLRLEANGLAGNLFDFYRYVAESTWLGGTYEYSELHESAPYWFNYIVPLAYIVDDSRLKSQAQQFLDYTLSHQAEDGWLGPETTRQTRGVWARSLFLFGLTQYAEAEPSQTERIVKAMHRFTILLNSMLRNNFTGLIEQHSEGDDFDPWGFGTSRTHELPVSLQWLYDNYPSNNSDLIWETMELMFAGGRQAGRDWTRFFVEGVFPTLGTPNIVTSGFTHGVNLAEGLRYPTVLYRMTKNESLIPQTFNAVNWTYLYHGSRAGSIIADEHLGNLSPQRGSETCMAVEMMFSMAYLYRFYGVNTFADNAERAAFNALPAALSPDWWAHQYVQQTNQPWSRNLTAQPYFNVVPYGNTFGLEPNFPCCTVNHGQGYPKFVASSYVLEGESSIIHSLLSPTTLRTIIRGSELSISCETNYPFSGRLRYSISCGLEFEFCIRIPSWATADSTFRVDANNWSSLLPNSDGLQCFQISSRKTTIEVNLTMAINIGEPRNGAVAIYYGPLLYALDIEYANATYHGPLNFTDQTSLPADQITPETHDWVLDATSEWRYAIDPTSLTLQERFPADQDLKSPIWDRQGPPVVIWADAWVVSWEETLGTAGLPPVNPVVSGESTRIRLIPYGAAKLHIAEFPVANMLGV
ncbi:hypothetical protein OIDMADRAFT_56776 [Oidiodendron maius Zn]|uniref:Non-reducing end beta-L-arabinofuranosidase-like GH127 catalytic domain-containing protein n=1 Tax=Oidiodendron maius (strain Zn) TaxID=913774 RepID=A0A0C3H7K4_OIDMZ|nr:hypothetical protein OIDMADRAFT_56776 [Oidiodendron maius Zn]